ncbi:MAG: 8-amino-7-oxononanoate synthase [Chitinophagaceae bacterium]
MPNANFLQQRLEERKSQNAFRELQLPAGKVDFCSNDYLGLAGIPEPVSGQWKHGSAGSRLLAGNSALAEETERFIAAFHRAEEALLFNSGYDANVGLMSCIAQKEDTIIYDFLSHASLRDGIKLSAAQAFSFRHNDLENLESRLKAATGNVFVVTESVFSMDGDMAPLQQIVQLCNQYGANLVVDEAHATGVVGETGEGLVQQLGLEAACFARVHTFGKAVGCHGAVVLGSDQLRSYLINFSRPFIYTTALPESSIAVIRRSYEMFPQMQQERMQLQQLITQFQQAATRFEKLSSFTPIQAVIVPGNDEVKQLAYTLQQAGLDVRPILYPTVPKNSERLRIVLHSFNTADELQLLLKLL